MTARRATLVAASLAATCSGCGADDDAPQCLPGESAACACDDGRAGTQRCLDVGAFEACRCDAGAGVAHALRFVTQPSSGRTCVPLPAFQVEVIDAEGARIDTRATLRLELADVAAAGAALGGTRLADSVGGVVTFDDVFVDTQGFGFSLASTSPDLVPAISATGIDVIDPPTWAFPPISILSEIYNAGGAAPGGLAVADLNVDGKLDVIATVETGTPVGISLMLDDGTAFQSRVSIPMPGISATGVGDLNGDGAPDLVAVRSPGGVAVMFNQTSPGAATPSFAAPVSYPAGTPGSVELVDVDGDGRLDVLVSRLDAPRVSVLLNRTAPLATAPTFLDRYDLVTERPTSAAAAVDLDGDGLPEIAAADEFVVQLFHNQSTGANLAFAPRQVLAEVNVHAIAAANLNGDSRPDLVILGATGAILYINESEPGQVRLARYWTEPLLGSYPSALAIGDVNGDGLDDVVCRYQYDPTLTAIISDRCRPGSYETTTYAMPNTLGLVLYDRNADGILDPMLLGLPGGTIQTLLMR